ncbi:MAG: hypothetical protein AAF756_15180 [Pseudomonadota bacterium]
MSDLNREIERDADSNCFDGSTETVIQIVPGSSNSMVLLYALTDSGAIWGFERLGENTFEGVKWREEWRRVPSILTGEADHD